VGVGVTALIHASGGTIAGNAFWSIMNVDLGRAFAERHSWPLVYDNDANLAALAERWRGHCVDSADFAVILAGERLGSGLVVGGTLLHGSRGAAGEMVFLDFTEGVGSAFGIAPLATQWGAEGVSRSLTPPGLLPGTLRQLSASNPDAVTAEMVFAAALAGDPAADRILDRIADRFARIIAALASMTNPETAVIAGAIAEASRALIPTIEKQLPLYTPVPPPRVFASALGSEIVSIGAIRTALDYTEQNALEIKLGDRALT
jgi:predicted NBD/HSP70 family sugar kinase